ncbi:hypothetical protein A5780_19670 [Nocardia sp. 852002-20019_SCH5090214]|uniref:DUF1702 domain-containing protein n=1 Tax=Nocardia nova TaxID=37330 RepID=A0A2S5ZZF1_9NOCA|nr:MULTISPECIES: DUF1702 family protein [Nocardia]OBA61482.1 hypothetical protein A5780_19670 [Nocardia sp. 852002-20019_SCH5090214]PPJ23850.1 DUF1702 domain-containing protein [Nocardia nova]
MPSVFGPVRSLLLGTGSQEPPLNRPGFAAPSPATAAELERVATHLASSIDMAVRSKNNDEVIATIAALPEQYRGFAFEGAATGLAAVDSITPFGRRAHDLIAGPAAKHDLTMYVGVGLAMGRIPKALWRKTLPKHESYRWLALDGYGFYNAFFHTEKWVGRHYVDNRLPRWMGDPAPLHRAIDQGIGRALWFIGGGSVDGVAKMIEEFDSTRHPDLWDGIGIATTFAGGVEVADLEAILARVPQFRTQLAAGAAMVAKIRQQADSATAHTHVAVRTYTGRGIDEAAALIDRAFADVPQDGTAGAYVAWRDRLGVLAAAPGDDA